MDDGAFRRGPPGCALPTSNCRDDVVVEARAWTWDGTGVEGEGGRGIRHFGDWLPVSACQLSVRCCARLLQVKEKMALLPQGKERKTYLGERPNPRKIFKKITSNKQ